MLSCPLAEVRLLRRLRIDCFLGDDCFRARRQDEGGFPAEIATAVLNGLPMRPTLPTWRVRIDRSFAMAAGEIRVLVVDDSAVIRALIADSIAAAHGMEVAGVAADGRQALEMLDSVQPDVITLDIQMPNMDGLATLDALLARRSVPVIMVSSLTRLGAEITLDALDRGAIDYLAKPDYGAKTRTALQDELPRKIRMAAGCDVRRIVEIRRDQRQRIAQRRRTEDRSRWWEAGSGADACRKQSGPITAILDSRRVGRQVHCNRDLHGRSARAGPVVRGTSAAHAAHRGRATHAAGFHETAGLASGLAQRSVRQRGRTGGCFEPNHVLIAPGGKHLQVRRAGNVVMAVIRDGADRQRPQALGRRDDEKCRRGLRRQLPGRDHDRHGGDGADGCRAIRAAGGCVVGQDQDSSDVYGMNKVAYVEGQVDRQFALGEAATVITHYLRRLRVAVSAV